MKYSLFAVATLLACLFLVKTSPAQPDLVWEKSLGGNGDEWLKGIAPSPDGGFILLGATDSSNDGDVRQSNSGGIDIWILKISPTGSVLWSKTIGGSGDDYGEDIIADPNGGYLLACTTNSQDGDIARTNNKSNPHGGLDIWLVKVDEIGSIEWSNSLGGSSDEIASDVFVDSSNQIVISGSTRSIDGDVANRQLTGGTTQEEDAWGHFLTQDGDRIGSGFNVGGDTPSDQRGVGSDRSYGILEVGGGRYVMGGHFWSGTGVSYVNAILLDSFGGFVDVEDNGSQSLEEGAYAMSELNNGNFIVGGFQWQGPNTPPQYLIREFRVQGQDILLNNEYRYGGSADDRLIDLEATSDGGWIATGLAFSSDGSIPNVDHKGNSDMFTFKSNSQGAIQWTMNLGGSDFDRAGKIFEISAGEYLLVGMTDSQDLSDEHEGGRDAYVARIGSTVAQVPSQPSLQFPSQGASNVADSFSFQWAASPNADSYEIEYSTNSSLNNPIQMTTSSTSSAVMGLLKGVQYYWRVRAINSVGASPWTSAFNFTTATGQSGIAAPSLSLPNNGSTDLSIPVLVEWQNLDGAASYELEWSRNAQFSSVGFSQANSTTAAISTDLDFGTQYYWRVRGVDGAGDPGPWSSVWNFTTSGQSTSIEDQNIRISDVQVYPNPTSGEFRIAAKGDVDFLRGVEIYDVSGKLVYKSDTLRSDSRIDWLSEAESEILPGFYLVSVRVGETGVVHRPLIFVD